MSNDEDLLEIITPQFQHVLPDGSYDSLWSFCRFLRKPQRLDELYPRETSTPIIIEGENNTLIKLKRSMIFNKSNSEDQTISLDWDREDDEKIYCTIQGPSKETVLEVAAMLWNLPLGEIAVVRIRNSRSIQSEELFGRFQSHYSMAQIIKVSLNSNFKHPDLLNLWRTSQGTEIYFSGANIESYLQSILSMKNVTQLTVESDARGLTNDILCQVLSAPVHSLMFYPKEYGLEETDLSSVKIAAKELEIINNNGSRSPLPFGFLAAVLNQVAQSQSLEKLWIPFESDPLLIPDELAISLISVIKGNEHLKMLRFGGGYHARWGKHIKDVLAVMKQNKGLCSINMDTERTDYNEYAVCICKEMHHHFLYFNRFSRLRQEDELIRPSLVGLTLCQPQYTLPVELLYLLLDMHTDTLCDLLFEYLEKADHD